MMVIMRELPETKLRMRENAEAVEDIWRLTPVQAGMLYDTLSAPGAGMYVEQFSYSIDRELDERSFRRAWEKVTERQAMMRAGVVWEKTEWPVQVIQRKVKLCWRVEEWGEKSKGDRDQALTKYLEEDREQGFDVRNAPLMRMALFSHRKGYEFVWSFHHLLMDGWSLPIVLGEVLSYYEGYRSGREAELEVVRPFRDYLSWLQVQDLNEAEVYWRTKLGGFRRATALPAQGGDRGRKKGHIGTEHGEVKVNLSNEITLRLQHLARQYQVTLNTVVEAMWAFLLSRYTGDKDVTFGATVSGRPPALAGVESMVGPFINTLPVRVRVCDEMRVSDWLKQLQVEHVEMRRFEHTPLSHIQRWSGIPLLCPLFESIFVFENYPEQTLRSRDGGMNASRHESRGNHERTRYPLTLLVTNNQCLTLQAIFRQNRLQRGLVEEVMLQLQRLIGKLVNAGDCEVGRLPGPTEQELRKFIVADPESSGQPYSTDTDTTTPYVLPRNPTEQMLAAVLFSLLGEARVGVFDAIWEIGSHSLMAAQLLAKVRQTFGVALSFAALLEAKNIVELAGKIDHMQKALGSLKSTPLVPIQSDGSRPPLFLVHPIGGGISFYVRLSRFLGSDQPVYGFQAQDLIGEEDSPGFERMEDLARSYVDAIQTVSCRGPYLIGGWSFGGIAAFEMARQLVERGEEVRLLALLDAYPPGKFHPELNRGEILLILGREAAAQAGMKIDLSAEHLRSFSFQDQCSWILEKLKIARLLPPEASVSAVHRYVDGYRKRLRFVLDYQPDRYPGSIALFRAAEWDPEFRAAIISKSEHDIALRAITEDATYGWNRFSARPVEVYQVPGTHGTLLTDENLPLLSRQLSTAIHAAA